MEIDEIREEITFAAAEAALAARFGIPTDAPLLFSLRYGGDWSYAAEGVTPISAVTRTNVYDEVSQTGYSLEEIYLFVDPVILHREGLRVFRWG
jgi:predicted metalloprotease